MAVKSKKTKRKTKAKKTGDNPVGRPSVFRPEMIEQGYRLTLLGYTNEKLATFFGVSKTAIDSFIKNNEEFASAIKRGKCEADGHIAESLYLRAKGGYVTEQVPVKLKETLGGGITRETVQVVTVQKYIPADTVACFGWLRNRQREIWSSEKAQQPEATPEEKGALMADAFLSRLAQITNKNVIVPKKEQVAITDG